MFQSKLEGTTLINNPEEIMYNLSSEMLNRISDYTISEVSSTILRLNQYFSKLDEENSAKLQENIKLVSENLLRFKDVVPKDSFFSLIRHLVYQIDNEKGVVKAVLENLIEELAMDTSIFKYLEKRENIE
jgi:alkaline phosphatase D